MARYPILAAIAPLTLVACASVAEPAPLPGPGKPADAGAASPVAGAATRVLDRAAAERLIANKGVTLQWIDWNTRGSAWARWDGGVLRLTGSQAQANGPGRLHLDGYVSQIGSDHFTFVGTIRITDTPDAGRRCEADKSWHFAVTQNRPYWRLREFEWCDGLTDYVDIYF